ncbi:MAG: hypothetical protein LBT38_01575 [Deltaproteobacteria bacterium]|jgi:hypothetical protein|nr:hypothetical protein [Deltaproteobacteria bacterium]
MAERFNFILSDEERESLELLKSKGLRPESLIKVQVLLLGDKGSSGPALDLKSISKSTGVSIRTILALKERVVSGGLEGVVFERSWPRKVCPDRLVNPPVKLVALARALAPPGAPQGEIRWALRLLADKILELGYSGVPRADSPDWAKPLANLCVYWKTPPRPSAEYASFMEDILSLYSRPYQELEPVVCLKLASQQLVGSIDRSKDLGVGRPPFDCHEYVRLGQAYIFLAVEPLTGARLVEVSPTKDQADWVKILVKLASLWPKAQKICLVLDHNHNLDIAILSQNWGPGKVNKLSDLFEIHKAPKFGDWLNQASLEFEVLKHLALVRPQGDVLALAELLSAWEAAKNQDKVYGQIEWDFTVYDARIQLKRFYPKKNA